MGPGILLREARRRHGLTQRQLAVRARTSQAAISRVERGVVSPTTETLGTLLSLMGEELVLDARPVDFGHDRTLLRARVALPVAERVARGVEFSRFAARHRGVARG